MSEIYRLKDTVCGQPTSLMFEKHGARFLQMLGSSSMFASSVVHCDTAQKKPVRRRTLRLVLGVLDDFDAACGFSNTKNTVPAPVTCRAFMAILE